MLLILDGNSEHVAHLNRKFCYNYLNRAIFLIEYDWSNYRATSSEAQSLTKVVHRFDTMYSIALLSFYYIYIFFFGGGREAEGAYH